MSGNWHISPKGRNLSLALEQNFLWSDGNIYIMDNHRAAMWCWLQHTSAGKEYSLFHIDAHYDTRSVQNAPWLSSIPDLKNLSINQYLDLGTNRNPPDNFPIISWDNYLSLFFEIYHASIKECFIATHEIGDKPDNFKHEHLNPRTFLNCFKSFLSEYPSDGWILNLDLDYFFCKEEDGSYLPMFSDQYSNAIFSAIADANASGLVKCLTIALSPECCGGWDNAEQMCSVLTKQLGISFDLP